MNHNIEERSKYAKDLLLKVRLYLLSTETIKHLLNDSTFTKIESCVELLSEILDYRDKNLYKPLNNYLTSRYCNQNYYELLVCGGLNTETFKACSNVSCVDVNKLGDVEAYPPMKTEREGLKVVYLKGDIFVFGGWNKDNDLIKSVDKYSLTSNTWSQIAEMNNDCIFFSLCAFIDKIFIIGGKKDGVRTNGCLQFDTSDYSWKEIAKMNEARSCAACAVFEEKIVFSGGLSNNRDNLNTVESYDVLPNKWSTMPNMNSGKYNHSLVVVNSKLYVISNIENNCEVFDNICKKFITINSPDFKCLYSISAHSIANKYFVFQDDSSKIFSYDTYKNEWLEESCQVTKNLRWFSSVKLPCL